MTVMLVVQVAVDDIVGMIAVLYSGMAATFAVDVIAVVVGAIMAVGTYGSVVIAVAVMLMVQVAVDQVIYMVTVGDGGMAAAIAVDVIAVVIGAIMTAGALSGIVGIDVEAVLVDMVVVNVMQVPIVKVIDVVAVNDGLVSAILTVLMIVSVVFLAVSHDNCSLFFGNLEISSLGIEYLWGCSCDDK